MKMRKVLVSLVIAVLLIRCLPLDEGAVLTQESEKPEILTPVSHNSPTAGTPTALSPANDCKSLKLASSFDSKGILILREGIENYKFFNMQTKAVSELGEGGDEIHSYVVSPDRKLMLAETCRDNDCHYILRNAHEVIDSMPMREDWLLWRWLDNQRVLILSLSEPYIMTILNPFTHDVTEIQVDIPDPFSIAHGLTEKLIPASVDVSSEFVVYYDQRDGGRIVLWSLLNQQEIVSLPHVIDRTVGYEVISGWSPDSQTLAFAGPATDSSLPNELYSLSMNGHVAQLSSYNQRHGFANISGPVWNPDNVHIGFWLRMTNSSVADAGDLPQHLAIMNVNTKEGEIYCLTFSESSFQAFPIIWSPDGRELITNTRLPSGEVILKLVDTSQSTETIINGNESMWVESWMMP